VTCCVVCGCPLEVHQGEVGACTLCPCQHALNPAGLDPQLVLDLTRARLEIDRLWALGSWRNQVDARG
jgi:hypothetical protein